MNKNEILMLVLIIECNNMMQKNKLLKQEKSRQPIIDLHSATQLRQYYLAVGDAYIVSLAWTNTLALMTYWTFVCVATNNGY